MQSDSYNLRKLLQKIPQFFYLYRMVVTDKVFLYVNTLAESFKLPVVHRGIFSHISLRKLLNTYNVLCGDNAVKICKIKKEVYIQM